MSFGTGHHATTYAMIEAMSTIDFTDKQVIDFGTGTGVLAILAERLGAAHVEAIDNDEWSIDNAAENIRVNGCEKISLVRSDTFISNVAADIILANINLNVITENMALLVNACTKEGNILLSGMLYEDEATISATLKEHGLVIKNIDHRSNWLVIWAQTMH
jgi:ribosomal protein L11 methyltransferase